jgi:hypothetical protein
MTIADVWACFVKVVVSPAPNASRPKPATIRWTNLKIICETEQYKIFKGIDMTTGHATAGHQIAVKEILIPEKGFAADELNELVRKALGHSIVVYA